MFQNRRDILELWTQCSGLLELRLTSEDFNTWIKPLSAETTNNSLEIKAPNDFILNQLGNFDFNNPTRPNYSYIIENIQRNGRTKFDNALDRVLFFEPDGTAISASCLMFRGDPNNPPSLAYDNIMKLKKV